MIARPADFTNFDQYLKLLTIWNNQQNQDAENLKNHDNFVADAQRWLVQAESQRNHNQPIPQKPALPVHRVYNDDGTIIMTAFTDLVLPELLSTGTPALSGSVVSPPAMDRTDVLLMLVSKICDKMGIK
jgi:hypothetical protein